MWGRRVSVLNLRILRQDLVKLMCEVSFSCPRGEGGTDEIRLTIERHKNLCDPIFVVDCLLRTGNQDIDDGIVQAAAAHCEKEKEGLEQSKIGVVKKPYNFVIPSQFHVESGFCNPKDPTRVDNKSFIRFQSIELEDKDKNIETCYFVYFFLLGWTTEQFEKKKSINLLGGGHSRRGGKKVIFSPGRAYGDHYHSSSGDAKSDSDDTSPKQQRKRERIQVSPNENKGF